MESRTTCIHLVISGQKFLEEQEVPGSERYKGTKNPWNFRSLDLLLPAYTFRSWERKVLEGEKSRILFLYNMSTRIKIKVLNMP